MEPMTFEVSRREERVVVAVSGNLDMPGVLRLEPALDEILASGEVRGVTLDLTGLASIDSMAMTLLVETYALARHHDVELRLCCGAAGSKPVVRISEVEHAVAARGECPRQESNLEPSD